MSETPLRPRLERTELVVSEIFGPTWQGEGPSLGRRAGFVRLGRCNLACTWCDSKYTWDWDRHDPAIELTRLPASEIVDQVVAMGVPLVVITGGEPLLQQSHLGTLTAALGDEGISVEIETAGTLEARPELVAHVERFNVSPKLESSGNPLEHRYKPDVLRAFAATGKSAFKFVATSTADLDEVARIVEACDLDASSVWIMPEGVDAAEVTARGRALADAALARGWNMTTRLHVLLWGDERGR